jgi:hypothetical protein
MTTTTFPLRGSRVAAALLWICAGAAVLATASALPSALSADAATRFVELWRVVGFATFAGLFAVLAAQGGRVPPAVWLILIVNKLVLTLIGLTLATSASGAGEAGRWDGTLTVLLVASFVLVRRRQA